MVKKKIKEKETEVSSKINFIFNLNTLIRDSMKWNNKFNYPKSSRSIEDGMRKYLLGDEKLPSVTSILKATKSEEDKASLELWKDRVGQQQKPIELNLKRVPPTEGHPCILILKIF